MNKLLDRYEHPTNKNIYELVENIKLHYINELWFEKEFVENIFSSKNIEKIKSEIFDFVWPEICSQFASEIFSQIETEFLVFDIDASENTDNIADTLCEIYTLLLDQFLEANDYENWLWLQCWYIIENQNPLKISIFPIKPEIERLEKMWTQIWQLLEFILSNYELTQNWYQQLSMINADFLDFLESLYIENFNIQNFEKNIKIFYEKLKKHKFSWNPSILKLSIILADLENLKSENIDYNYINQIFSSESETDFINFQISNFDFSLLEELKTYNIILPFLERYFKQKFIEQNFSNSIFLAQNSKEKNLFLSYIALEIYLSGELTQEQESFNKIFLAFQKSPNKNNSNKLINFFGQTKLNYIISNKLFETFMTMDDFKNFSYPEIDEIFENSQLQIEEKIIFSSLDWFWFRKPKKTEISSAKSQLAKALEEFDNPESQKKTNLLA